MNQDAIGGLQADPFSEHVNQYEAWFAANDNAYQAELRAVSELIPASTRTVEIGVGTGRFAGPLGITFGLDPSLPMLRIARDRGIQVAMGVGEDLPLPDSSFDLALMVTTVCFLHDLQQAFQEVHRILGPGGGIIVGLVDRASALGAQYLRRKEENVFYRSARFYTVKEIVTALSQVGFVGFDYRQTLFVPLNETLPSEPVTSGYGEGSFVAIGARAPVH
jgi:SAM-dependent methyltransferase